MRSDPVGVTNITERLSLLLGREFPRGTVAGWDFRRRRWHEAGRPQRRARDEPMPDPRWPNVNGSPAWDWSHQIAPWLVKVGVLPAEKQHETPWAA